MTYRSIFFENENIDTSRQSSFNMDPIVDTICVQQDTGFDQPSYSTDDLTNEEIEEIFPDKESDDVRNLNFMIMSHNHRWRKTLK